MNRASAFLLLLSLALLAAPVQAARVMKNSENPRAAPAFELPATDGSVRRLADFEGRYLLVNFWAVWCSPCRKEMPSMQRVYEELRSDDFELIAIHVGPSLDGAKKYAEQLGLSFPVLVDAEMALGRWQVQGLPTTLLLDPDGRIIAEAVGERDWDSPEIKTQLEGHLSLGSL